MKVKEYVVTTNFNDNPVVHIVTDDDKTSDYGHYDELRKAILRGEWFNISNMQVYFVRCEHVGPYSNIYMYLKG